VSAAAPRRRAYPVWLWGVVVVGLGGSRPMQAIIIRVRWGKMMVHIYIWVVKSIYQQQAKQSSSHAPPPASARR
jgi:hypothetical protein